jgi:hypothetical protein
MCEKRSRENYLYLIGKDEIFGREKNMKPSLFRRKTILLLLIEGLLAAFPPLLLAVPETLLLFDISDSMGEPICASTKIDVAKEVVRRCLRDYSEKDHIGLRTFGGERSDSTEMVIPVQWGTKDLIIETIQNLKPNGGTPLIYAIRESLLDFHHDKDGKSVLLISDGMDSYYSESFYEAIQEVRESNQNLNLSFHVILLNPPPQYGICSIKNAADQGLFRYRIKLSNISLAYLIAFILGALLVLVCSHFIYRILVLAFLFRRRIAGALATFFTISLIYLWLLVLFTRMNLLTVFLIAGSVSLVLLVFLTVSALSLGKEKLTGKGEMTCESNEHCSLR